MQNTDTPPRPHSLRLSRRTQHFRNIRFLDPAPLHLKPCVRCQSYSLTSGVSSIFNHYTTIPPLLHALPKSCPMCGSAARKRGSEATERGESYAAGVRRLNNLSQTPFDVEFGSRGPPTGSRIHGIRAMNEHQIPGLPSTYSGQPASGCRLPRPVRHGEIQRWPSGGRRGCGPLAGR